jgi:aspartate kinase
MTDTLKNQKKIVVQKFGGTSVKNPERIKSVATRAIEELKRNPKLVIVVSAMGDTTDKLVELSKELSTSPNPREYDALISTGENISAALLAMCLIDMGVDAISLTGLQAGIKTEGPNSRSKIIDVDTTRILEELNAGKVVIVTGFQGFNTNYDTTTIGRGGSDTSAVVLAAALGSPECDIFTDVDGVYTTDPRRVKDARKLKTVSYEEMLELASLGAQVLHPRAVECAKENNIIIHVRSSYSNEDGTRVKELNKMEVNKPVTGVTVNEKESIISVLDIPDEPGFAGKLFTRLAEHKISVDMIIQNVEKELTNNISFSVLEDDLEDAKAITETFAKESKSGQVLITNAIAKISAVGVGMISKPGIAAKMFSALGEANINIKRITTSEIKISCAIDRSDAQKALEVLHSAFDLANA